MTDRAAPLVGARSVLRLILDMRGVTRSELARLAGHARAEGPSHPASRGRVGLAGRPWRWRGNGQAGCRQRAVRAPVEWSGSDRKGANRLNGRACEARGARYPAAQVHAAPGARHGLAVCETARFSLS